MSQTNNIETTLSSSSPIHIPIYPHLNKIGDSHVYNGEFDLKEINFGEALYSFATAPKYKIELTNTGDAILLQGSIEVQAKTVCVRCLKEININIIGDVQGYFLLNKSADKSQADDEDYSYVDSNNTICIDDNLYAAITYELPYTPLCKEDCLGLCQHCGCNLNNAKCDCEEKLQEEKSNEINPNSPFAILKDYQFSDEDN